MKPSIENKSCIASYMERARTSQKNGTLVKDLPF